MAGPKFCGDYRFGWANVNLFAAIGRSQSNALANTLVNKKAAARNILTAA
ncbi:MAG: hypothetical protein ACI9FR_001688 [Cryomorphaceae bacterium]|jgi:hypothetical protein